MRASLTLLPLLAAAAYYLPRHLAPNPTYPHLYPPYLIRGYPDTAALENRQTIINDYITSQQMHHNAATAMAQRADILRGLSPRESSLALNYATGPRGGYRRCSRPVGGQSRPHPPGIGLIPALKLAGVCKGPMHARPCVPAEAALCAHAHGAGGELGTSLRLAAVCTLCLRSPGVQNTRQWDSLVPLFCK